MSEQKKPQIRFKGFREDWEQRELGEITESYSGGTPSVGNSDYYYGDIPFIRSAEINSNYTELFITEKGLNNSSAKLVNVGDILYALYGATSGEVGIAKLKGAINQAILAIQPKPLYNTEFLMQWLRKSKKNIVDTYLQGGQGNLSGSIVKDLQIECPTYTEQDQIGQFLSNFDNLITLHQRKLEKLKNIKKACLEKMFPKDGADTPEIRFKGFSEPWEQHKVSEVADIIGGGTPSTNNPDYWDGNIDWYAPAEMEGQRYATGSVKRITELGLQKSSAQMLPARRTVLFTSRAGIGKMAILQHSAATNQGFQSIVLKDGCNPYFIYSLGSDIKDKAESVASGSTFLEISGRMLGNLVISVPSMQEQDKIADCFRHLDDLITLHQRKLEKLKNIKKACLEKMFI